MPPSKQGKTGTSTKKKSRLEGPRPGAHRYNLIVLQLKFVWTMK
jgi:hypothetical protein